MKSKKIILIFLAMAFIASGCASRTPLATNFPTSSQHMVRSAHHWDVMAADTAYKIQQKLLESNYVAEQPIYLEKKSNDSSFEKGFYDFLTTYLVEYGVNVTENPKNALKLSCNSELVRHRGNRMSSPQFPLTKLTIAGIIYHNLMVTTPSPWVLGATALSATALIDHSNMFYDSPSHTEIMVTTSIKDGDTFVARKSDVYYVEDFNRSLFQSHAPSKKMELINK